MLETDSEAEVGTQVDGLQAIQVEEDQERSWRMGLRSIRL